MAVLGTIAILICLVWIIQVAAVLLMYAWAVCTRRRGALGNEAWPSGTAHTRWEFGPGAQSFRRRNVPATPVCTVSIPILHGGD